MLFRNRNKTSKWDEDRIIYFAYNNKTMGEFTIMRDGDERYIYNLEIYEEYRNQGYGNLMIAEIVELYNNTPYPLTLAVAIDNSKALHLYKKYGFVIVEQGCVWGREAYIMKYERN